MYECMILYQQVLVLVDFLIPIHGYSHSIEKNVLAAVIQICHEQSKKWLPLHYDVAIELVYQYVILNYE
jgi:hypothetical protein